jgi:hypothetical protein
LEDFFRNYYTFITHSVEFIAAISGLIFFKKYKDAPAKYVVYFFVYVYFVDVLGNYPKYLHYFDAFHLIEGLLIEKNYWWYNLFWWFGLSSFISFLNYKVIKKSIYKTVLKVFYGIYLLQTLIYAIINFDKIFSADGYFLSFASVWVIVMAVILYFLDILQSDQIMYFYKSIYFYVNALIFLWITVVAPLDFYEIYFTQADWNYVILKWQIYLGINIIFYLTLTAAIIFCKPETK